MEVHKSKDVSKQARWWAKNGTSEISTVKKSRQKISERDWSERRRKMRTVWGSYNPRAQKELQDQDTIHSIKHNSCIK